MARSWAMWAGWRGAEVPLVAWSVVNVMTVMTAMSLVVVTAAAAPVRAESPAAQQSPPDVDVHVQRNGDIWIADFDFARGARVWAFAQSALVHRTNQPWRPAQWTVLTPGVLLQHTGRVDTLSMADGTSLVPAAVRVLLRPQGGPLLAANSPALIFSNGAVALYGRQFDALALPSLDATRALPQDPGGLSRITPPARVTMRDSAGPVLAGGGRVAQAVLQGADSYVLFGSARDVQTPNLAAVIDPNLPAWVADEIAAFVTRSIDHYAARLGPRTGAMVVKPTVMVAWDKTPPNVTHISGSLLPNLMVILLEGARLQTPQPHLLQHLRWLFAHEAAHFWLGQEVAMASDAETWIGEGGADLMAWRAMQQLRVPGVDVAAGLRAEVAECVALSLPNQPLATARARGAWRVPYACGLVLGLVAEAALQRSRPEADFFDFIGPLIAGQRSSGSISAAAWRDALLHMSGDAQLVDDIRRFTDDGVADPQAWIGGLLQRAGVRL